MNTFDAENHHVREILIVAYEQYKRIHVPKHAHLVTAEIITFNKTQFTSNKISKTCK